MKTRSPSSSAARSASGDCNADITEQPVRLQTLNSRYRDEAVKFVQQHAKGSSGAGSAKGF